MSRMLEDHLPTVPVLEDVESVDGTKWVGQIDGILAGFPCQAMFCCGLMMSSTHCPHV